MSTPTDILRAAARWQLVPPAQTVRVTDASLDRVLAVARQDRLGPMLAGAARDGVLIVDQPALDRILDLEVEQLVGAVAVETVLLDVADVFDRGGVRWRLSKGSAFAHLDYPDPALRPFGDIDVIVHPDSWEPALDAAVAAGWQRDRAQLAPGFDAAYGKGATLRNDTGFELDLHRRLAIGRYGLRLDTTVFFDDVQPLRVAGRWLPAPSGPLRLMHACFHAVLGGFQVFRAVRDVAQMLLVSPVDWRHTVDVAEAYGVDVVVASAVMNAWTRLELDVDHPCHDWAQRCDLGRWDRRMLGVFANERPFAEQALTAVPDLVGRGATRYVIALSVQSGRGTPFRVGDVVRRGRRVVGRYRSPSARSGGS